MILTIGLSIIGFASIGMLYSYKNYITLKNLRI
jgi:hypothetical protein